MPLKYLMLSSISIVVVSPWFITVSFYWFDHTSNAITFLEYSHSMFLCGLLNIEFILASWLCLLPKPIFINMEPLFFGVQPVFELFSAACFCYLCLMIFLEVLLQWFVLGVYRHHLETYSLSLLLTCAVFMVFTQYNILQEWSAVCLWWVSADIYGALPLVSL